ncbi:unnamed protein product [Nippostrongylus brasiliensis]|uniref:Protein C3orf33 (inferred by orthology to a human protein) n=1 Tax=Nippostrongylus brasiliensis TaxID=27835 RepID=A0A158R0U1_NIPBR|nr:unnamed protein product [Nippostrongylus brasiliensis]
MGEGDTAPATTGPAKTQVTSAGDTSVKFVDPIDRYAALLVRGSIVGIGLVGVGLFLRNSRLFARFEHVAQIPKEFVRKELELKGTVREVLPTGELRVEHSPIVRLPSIFRKKPAKGLLNLRLAGVDISEAGQQFLSKDLRLKNKPITFTVIKVNIPVCNTDGAADSVDADVTVKKNAFSRTNLNIEVVRRGYARVPPPESPHHLKSLQSIPAYSRLVNRLLMSEKVSPVKLDVFFTFDHFY